MQKSRIDNALQRLEAAISRLANAQKADPFKSARVTALVNNHEKLREEVADTLREFDGLIDELEK